MSVLDTQITMYLYIVISFHSFHISFLQNYFLWKQRVLEINLKQILFSSSTRPSNSRQVNFIMPFQLATVAFNAISPLSVFWCWPLFWLQCRPRPSGRMFQTYASSDGAEGACTPKGLPALCSWLSVAGYKVAESALASKGWVAHTKLLVACNSRNIFRKIVMV